MLPMRDKQTNKRTLKIELLSQWKLEAEFRNMTSSSGGSGELMGDSGDVEMWPSSHELQ